MEETKEDIFMFNHSLVIYKQSRYILLILKDMLKLPATEK